MSDPVEKDPVAVQPISQLQLRAGAASLLGVSVHDIAQVRPIIYNVQVIDWSTGVAKLVWHKVSITE